MATTNTPSLRERREQIVRAHIEAETVTHDIGAAVATFYHPRYEVPAAGVIANGGEAVEGLLRQLLGAFPDFWLKPSALHHGDDAVIVVRADGVDLEEVQWCRAMRARPAAELNPPPLLTGNDLMAHGIPSGPLFRTLLDAVRDAQLDGRVENKEQALTLVDQWVASQGRD